MLLVLFFKAVVGLFVTLPGKVQKYFLWRWWKAATGVQLI
jgi:hypothetical protein